MNTGILKAEGLCKSYGTHQVLHNLDLELLPGKIYGLIGRNGARTHAVDHKAHHIGVAVRKQRHESDRGRHESREQPYVLPRNQPEIVKRAPRRRWSARPCHAAFPSLMLA